jgi:hypothetical protein
MLELLKMSTGELTAVTSHWVNIIKGAIPQLVPSEEKINEVSEKIEPFRVQSYDQSENNSEP